VRTRSFAHWSGGCCRTDDSELAQNTDVRPLISVVLLLFAGVIRLGPLAGSFPDFARLDAPKAIPESMPDSSSQPHHISAWRLAVRSGRRRAAAWPMKRPASDEPS